MKDYLSYSQISMYLRCGEQYRRRYVENQIIPPTIAMLKGRSVHKGAEYNYRQKIQSHEDLRVNDIVEVSVNDYELNTKDTELFLSDEEKTIGKKKVVAQAKDSVVNTSILYAEKLAPQVQPVLVEEKIEFVSPGGIRIMSIIDCADVHENVRDMKVTGKSKTQDDADKSIQFTLYANAYFEKTGKLPKALVFDALVEKKEPEYKPVVTTRTADSLMTAHRIIESVAQGINAGVYLPAQEGSWVCSPKFCGYYNTCKFIKSIF